VWEFRTSLASYGSGEYRNYPPAQEAAGVARGLPALFFAGNLGRLQRAKGEYDPEGRFRRAGSDSRCTV